VKGKPTRGGSWITPLFYGLYKETNMEMGSIVPILKGNYQKKIINNIQYYSIPIDSGDNTKQFNTKLVQNYLQAIDDFKPDIIHIHGVEKNFGLLRKHIDANIPIVCSIQGLINPYYLFLKYSVATLHFKKYMSLKNWLGVGGIKVVLKNWKNYCIIEKEILEINTYFIGRTLWDRSQLAAFNSSAIYFQGEELLREPFYNKKWSIKDCTRYRVFISSSAYPIKGFHVLLKAAAILKDKYPNIQIVSPLSDLNLKSVKFKDYLIAEDYSNYLKKEIRRLNLEDNLVLLKRLNDEEMSNEFTKAHLFVLSSFVENSPNSLGEAMMIGTPSIVTPVGGVMSIVKDEKSALFFPSGDYSMLAYQISRVFEDDALAINLSENAKLIASIRHDVNKTTEQYKQIYSNVIKLHKDKKND
jgi:glycosyltransferase involved in cell wall biosynthesis